MSKITKLARLAKRITSIAFRIQVKKIFREDVKIHTENELERLLNAFREKAAKKNIEVPQEKEKLFIFVKQLSLSTINKKTTT
ncbi:MAG: hypothetical protein ACOYMB_02675 [Patescibacteria group bacterium]